MRHSGPRLPAFHGPGWANGCVGSASDTPSDLGWKSQPRSDSLRVRRTILSDKPCNSRAAVLECGNRLPMED
jgi:hypothetical protein